MSPRARCRPSGLGEVRYSRQRPGGARDCIDMRLRRWGATSHDAPAEGVPDLQRSAQHLRQRPQVGPAPPVRTDGRRRPRGARWRPVRRPAAGPAGSRGGGPARGAARRRRWRRSAGSPRPIAGSRSTRAAGSAGSPVTAVPETVGSTARNSVSRSSPPQLSAGCGGGNRSTTWAPGTGRRADRPRTARRAASGSGPGVPAGDRARGRPGSRTARRAGGRAPRPPVRAPRAATPVRSAPSTASRQASVVSRSGTATMTWSAPAARAIRAPAASP